MKEKKTLTVKPLTREMEIHSLSEPLRADTHKHVT